VNVSAQNTDDLPYAKLPQLLPNGPVYLLRMKTMMSVHCHDKIIKPINTAQSDSLGGNLCESKLDVITQSEGAARQRMLDEQQEMFNDVIWYKMQPHVQYTELMEVNQEYCRESI